MQNQSKIPQNDISHPGGDTTFWQDETVRKYDYQQSLLSEKKEEVLDNLIRILVYLCKLNSINKPKILDIGCGPGSPMTLSAYILKKVTDACVTGVDASSQMVESANNNLGLTYGERFVARIGDFNSLSFWNGTLNQTYDFVVSSGVLHYLSDERQGPFLKEVYEHLKSEGFLLACIANSSTVPEIAEMEQTFRLEYTYHKLEGPKKPHNFNDFKKGFQDVDRKANINWKSQSIWIDALRSAGFKKADVVYQIWVRSIFIALK